MNIQITKIDINRFDELNIFSNEDFIQYKDKRIKQINNNECDVFVISYENKYIGEITVKYVNGELETETIPNVRVYLEAFRIIDEYQRNGLGSKLLEYVINYLKKQKYTEFTIGVEEDNEVAKHLYNKFGFIKKIDIGYDKESKSNYTLYLKKEDNMEEFNIIRNAVRCFYIKDNKVIALKLNENNKNAGFWDIPGGKIEDNETMEEAAIREFKEEAGLDITNPIYRGVIYVVFPRGTLQLNILVVDDYKGTPNTLENHVPGLYDIDEITNSDKRYACTLILDPFYKKVLLDRNKTFEMIVHSSDQEVVSKVEFEIREL